MRRLLPKNRALPYAPAGRGEAEWHDRNPRPRGGERRIMSQGPTSPAGADEFLYAGFWRRFGAMIVDLVLMFVFMAIIGQVIPVWQEANLGYLPDSERGMAVGFDFELNSPGTLVFLLVYWVYSTLLESSRRQATVGKMALSIKVTDLDGERVGIAQAAGRNLAKLLSLATLAIGFMLAGWTARKQALHDLLARTLVISKS